MAKKSLIQKLKIALNKKANLKSLHNWNIKLAVLHFVQAIAVVALAKNSALPITTSYLNTDNLASKAAGHPVLVSATRNLFSVNLAYLVAVFFVVSAVTHLLVATRYRKDYETGLRKGINKFRWVEYGISAGFMMVAIALLTGVYDASSLLMIFALIFIMNMMGLLMEVHNQTTKTTSWLSYGIGALAGIVPWVVVAMYLKGAIFYGSGKIPTFVYWIYGSLFVLFASFAVNMYLQYKQQGKWADYLYGERVYMILSLVAKTALAWQIFFGSLRP